MARSAAPCGLLKRAMGQARCYSRERRCRSARVLNRSASGADATASEDHLHRRRDSAPPDGAGCGPAAAGRAARPGLHARKGLRASRQPLNARARELQLVRRAQDLFPGRLVHGDAVAAAPLAYLALRLSCNAHAIEARRRPTLSQPIEEQARFAVEGSRGTKLPSVEQDGEHAVQHALLARLVVMPRAATGKRATEQLARDCHAVALVLAKGEHCAERRNHRIARIISRRALRIDQASGRDLLALV